MMRFKEVLYALFGIAIGFVAGFMIANSINRSEVNALKAEIENSETNVKNGSDKSSDAALSRDEIRAKVAEADNSPNNLAYQKNLGLALYRYGAIKNDPEIITEAARLLDRAIGMAPDDKEIIIGLGNAWFDIGYMKKDGAALSKARYNYEKVLVNEPNNIDVRTDLAITYFLENPPNDVKAVEEFRRALAIDPKNEKALEFIIQSLARQGDNAQAAKYLAVLKESHPSNPSLPGLAEQVGSAKLDPVR